ncbi:hypothetical protein H7992_14630 [Sporosarcina sp. resist]|uniref:hypothetical protein n=1 Tax=Sporosarcina TaxID=1569 RepID=UPI00078BAF96|nr:MULTISPECIES: hypothetical protein [Sporosarcina]AMQ06801.1 hypothetical protein AZE41_13115 [Sporosarcina psychrophila]QNK86493.1 hypothetical protein H7992_14630 [Sporosarcina sp. resist]
MIREILRAVGIGCILAAGILYFTIDSKVPSDNETQQLQANVEKLQSELAKTKELLATAQTTSSVKENVPKTDAEKAVSKEDDAAKSNPSSDAIIKTILTIENGSNSTVVSATLEELGIIENAAIFESYLEEYNLTGKIQIGEHQVDSSMNFKTIAKEITTVKK